MSKIFHVMYLSILVLALNCTSTKPKNSTGILPYVPESKVIHDSIVLMDSIFFEAYNTCKMDVMESLISDDVEFYHDRGGLTTLKSQILDATRRNICGKVTRELLKGSIEVYPIPGYGAIQIGAHRFINHQEMDKGPSRYSKFIHTWHRENSNWKLARIISLH